MKLQPKTFPDAIFPIMILNWLTGLSVFEYPLGKSRLLLTFFYVLLSTSVYCYAYYQDPFKKIPDENEIRSTTFLVLKSVNFFVSTCCIFIGWYYYKEFKIMIQRMELLEETLKSLGLPNNYRKVIANTLLKTVMWFFIVTLLLLSDLIFLIQLMDLATCLHVLYLFQYPIHLNSVVDITFTSIVNYTGLTFDNINLLLKRTFSIGTSQKTAKQLYKNHSSINAIVISTKSSGILNNERQKEMIILIRHLHMELTKISLQVNKIYYIQIAMVIVAYLVTMTGFFYVFFTATLLKDEISSKTYKSIFSVLVWCVLYVYRFLNVNLTCAFANSKSRKTRDILYRMKTTIQDTELKEEVEQFSLQLTQQSVVLSVCGFTLGYPFIKKVIRTATTYIVILINMTLNKAKD